MPHPFLSTSRRGLLKGLGGLALGAPLLSALRGQAANGQAERVIFFYFPDGVVGPSQNGEASLWHCTGSESSFQLSETLQGLSNHKDRCVFFNGLSMGATDSGSHPGGAKKLLTAADYGNNESIDQYLARTAGWSSPWRHLLLGVQANYNNASGDKHISYPVAGSSLPPEDDPRQAFADIFGSYNPGSADSGGTAAPSGRAKVIGAVKEDLLELRGQLGGVEKDKLDYHVSSLEELENRLGGGGGGGTAASCGDPAIDTSAINDGNLYDAGTFPAILRAQIDLMVTALACDMTRVASLQCSHTVSPTVCSWVPGIAEGHHSLSHIDDSNVAGVQQFVDAERWFAQQFVYLVQKLADTPEADGTGSMLDNSVVLWSKEMGDSRAHVCKGVPFVIAGKAGGRFTTGRYLKVPGETHGKLLVSLCQAMGVDVKTFGNPVSGTGPLAGLV